MATKKATPAKAAAKKTSAKAATSAPKTAVPAKKPAGKKITKTELVRTMADKMELPTKQVVAFFDLLAQTSAEHTKKIGEFTIPGIGKLVKAQRAARMGRNPATGEAIKIKAKTTLKFRIAKPMKDAVLPAGK